MSPDTIVKWIKAASLPAQRTMGGQYRIFVNDLRQFMTRNGMSTDPLDAELESRPYCWEVHREPGDGGQGISSTCKDCPAYQVRALNCFELRAFEVEGPWAHADCARCNYYRKWAKQPSGETHESLS